MYFTFDARRDGGEVFERCLITVDFKYRNLMWHETDDTALEIQKARKMFLFIISTASLEVPDIERVDLEQALKKAPLVL